MCAVVGPDTMADLLLYLGLFLVMFSIISMDFFQLEAAQAGYLMSFFGVLQMVSEACVENAIGLRGLSFPALVSGRPASRMTEWPSWLPPLPPGGPLLGSV